MDRLLPMREVTKLVGLSKTTIYELIKTGEFIVPTQLTPFRIAFKSSLIERWIDSRPFVAAKKGGIANVD